MPALFNTIRNQEARNTGEEGFALLMTTFVVALATLLVLGFAEETFQYQRTTHNYTERIQADFVLKSAMNLGKVLLELPKQEGISEDWLGEPWALLAGAQTLPISDFPGELKVMIVDEGGKIDINSVGSNSSTSTSTLYPTGSMTTAATTAQGDDRSNFWKNALRELLEQQGFIREAYGATSFRTLGNTAFAAADQVAIINDWVDSDSNSHSSASFPGEGIESSADSTWFYNRSLRSISELALVPGMTIERLSRLAPFIRVSPNGNSRVNVNTAPAAVLIALGFPESQVEEMERERVNLPITKEMLSTLVTGDTQLGQVTTVTSQEYSIFAEAKMPSVSRWAKATIVLQGGLSQRTAVIKSIELM